MSPVTFKVTFERTIRRFQADGEISWQDLVSKVKELFSLNEPTDALLQLTYTDEDGDQVTLNSDEELRTILADAGRQGAHVIRFSLKRSTDSQETEDQTPDSTVWVFAEEGDDEVSANEPSEEKANDSRDAKVDTVKESNTEPAPASESHTPVNDPVDNKSSFGAYHRDILSEERSVSTGDSSDDEHDDNIDELEADPIPTDNETTPLPKDDTETKTETNQTKQGTAIEHEHTDSENDQNTNSDLPIVYIYEETPTVFRTPRFLDATNYLTDYWGNSFFRPYLHPALAHTHSSGSRGRHTSSAPTFTCYRRATTAPTKCIPTGRYSPQKRSCSLTEGRSNSTKSRRVASIGNFNNTLHQQYRRPLLYRPSPYYRTLHPERNLFSLW